MLALMLAGAAAACSLTPAVERDLRILKTQEWPRIYREADVQALEALLAPGFQVIAGDGTVAGKVDEIAYLRTKKPDPPGRRFAYAIERLEVYPNCTAVVSGKGEVSDPGRPTSTYRSSNVLVLEGGRWRAISSHVSGEQTAKP